MGAATTDYRYDPFQDVLNAINISGETHTIPSVSPYSIRLAEVPLKETPSSISLTIGGLVASEVSAPPAAGEFWPDYSTGADGDDNWNTGTILFNASAAGKTVVVAYKGTGTLTMAKETSQVFIFTSSGSITAPPWAKKALVSGCGGGGGGGGNPTTVYGNFRGGRGGYGGQCVDYPVVVTAGATYTITIGAAGAGRSGSTSGTAGGTTSFGSILSLAGGASGAAAGNSANGADGSVGSGVSDNTIGLFGKMGALPTSAGNGNASTGYGSPGSGAYAGASYTGGNGKAGLLIIKWVA